MSVVYTEITLTCVLRVCSHGEQLGDHFLTGKQGFFESSYHIPMIIRDPRPEAAGRHGTVVDEFSEHVGR